jgi:outer membrane protein OmpA-like peptidoglycan-associated protein
MIEFHHHLFNGCRCKGLLLGVIAVTGMLFIGGCQTMSEIFTMKTPEGQEQKVTMPESTCSGTASGEQANVLAKTVVDANNNTMARFDAVDKRLDKIQDTANKVQETSNQGLQTSQQTLAKQEQMASQQGAGELTLMFRTRSAKLDPVEYQRLVRFVDYISLKSHGRKVILVSIGSSSEPGKAKYNKRLSMKRAEAPLPVIKKYLVNVPYEFHKVIGTGEEYAPKNVSREEAKRHQSVRLIAVYDTKDLPKLPEEKQ